MEKINFNFEVPQDPYVEVYGPDGKLVMRTNDEKKFLNICCQIKDAHAEGYYITILDDETGKPEMDKEGGIITYPIKPYGMVTGAGGKMFYVHGEMLRKLMN